MKVFLVMACVALAGARPEAGYSYSAPNRGGGFGGGQVGSFGSSGFGSSGLGGSYQGGSSGGFSVGSSGGFHAGSSSSGFHAGSSSGGFQQGGFAGGSSGGFTSGGFSGGSLGGFGGGSSGGFSSGGSSGSFGGGFNNGVAQQTLVQKHIYVHVPPPETEEIRPQQQFSSGVAQKHYKIIFIKAPSAPAPTQQQIALAAQNQEKTIVYVLVKKPEELGDISLPQAIPTQPTKPEVYFIKYKAQRESGGGSIGGGSSIVGGGSSSIGFENSGHFGGAIHGGSGQIGSGLISSGGGAILGGGGHISSGSATSSISGGVPAANYGPPGHSGPY